MQNNPLMKKSSRKKHVFQSQKPRRRTHKEKILSLFVSSSSYDARRQMRLGELSYVDAIVDTITKKKIFTAAGAFCVALTITGTLMNPTSTSYLTASDRPAVANEKVVTAPVEPAQNFTVQQNVQASTASRDSFIITDPPPPVIKQKLAFANMKKADTYINDPYADVQYPFGFGSPISDGFGPRTPICFDGSCTNAFHAGTDFTPGEGTEIQAIADGVVKEVSNNGSGSFGSYVILEHTIDGDKVESTYAHMLDGSSPLVKGQKVVVGDLVGEVGNTGSSTGAHLHLEIRVNDVAVDPLKWDKWNFHIEN